MSDEQLCPVCFGIVGASSSAYAVLGVRRKKRCWGCNGAGMVTDERARQIEDRRTIAMFEFEELVGKGEEE